MKLGIYSNTFKRDSVEAVMDAVVSYGLDTIHFDASSVGLPSMPDEMSDEVCQRVRVAVDERGINVVSISGTFNMIHPDVSERERGLRQLEVLAEACGPIGTDKISLCSGTRNRDSMWRRHPDNDLPNAWDDMLVTMRAAVAIAEKHNVVLVVEPEVANVVDSAAKARRMLDEIQSPYLKIVFDGANVFHTGELAQMHSILDESIALLGDDIVLAHAKDLDKDGQAGHLAAGTGFLDYGFYLGKLRSIGFADREDSAVVMHGLTEAQVPWCAKFVQGIINQGQRYQHRNTNTEGRLPRE